MEQVKKQMSQIESEINEMNEVMDKNLNVHETGDEVAQAVAEDVADDDNDEGYQELRKLTAKQVDQFVQNAIKSDAEDEVPETLSRGREMAKAGVRPTPPSMEATAAAAAEAAAAKPEPESEPTVQPTLQPAAELTTQPVSEPKAPVPKSNTEATERQTDKQPGHISPVSQKRVVSAKIEASTSTEEDQAVPSTDKSNTYPAPAATAQAPNSPASRTFTPRSNPFRVVHVGSQPNSRNTSRNSSRVSSTSSESSDLNFEQLQKNYNLLSAKCTKLQKEIDYLNKFQYESTLTLEDRRKLVAAIEKLQEYLDKKNKQRYDTGVVLSRQIRKNVDMGNNGQFWVGRS